jgi:hypothetical protein
VKKMAIRGKYIHGIPMVIDVASNEHIAPMAPVVFQDDFLGAALQKYVTGENTTALWKTTETNLNTGIALVDDAVNGVAAIILDVDDNAEVGALHFGDNLCLSLLQGLVMEFRATFHVLPTTGTEDVQAVMGLASAHNTDLDTIGTNAWFRVESAAQTALLWEADNPGGTDDDDNAAGVTLVADTYNVYRIDATDNAAVKFYVDGNLVGTADMSTSMSTADALVQPYFNVSKAVSSNNTGTGTLYVDYVRVWMKRS